MGPRHARVLGGALRATRFAGLATGLAIGLALLGSGAANAKDAKTFMGFRLLDLENQTVKWRTPTFGRSAVVTYAFATSPVTTPGARNCASMLPPAAAYEPSQISKRQFRSEVAAAFRMWEKVAEISFRETSDSASAGILIGAQGQPLGRAFTNVALKQGIGRKSVEKKVIGRSLICLNPKQPWKVGFDGRLGVYDLRYTIAHEIGHAIGLDHPSAAGQLMSYRYDEKQNGLQPGDIKGAVLLYGPRAGTRRFATASGDGNGEAPADAARGWPFGIGDGRAGSSPKAVDPR
jgi:hypothetical protein